MDGSAKAGVRVRQTPVVIPTYQPQPPDRNPMFLERRVYQGSSGRVYPLPCVERFADQKSDRTYKAVYIENEFLEVMILPELGGRIHAAKDKTNGYDLIYRNRVIKPALIGLAGAWASGGIEFNWPQHHRPSTFMPTDVHIERHDDGSITVWMSEHDPLCRMKGMHGVCLHPGRAVVEVKVRAYNRTPFVQTFLWWANVATAVHEGYQSFLPPDVTHVADHARGTVTTYPLSTNTYYGIDYAKRGKSGIPKAEAPPHYVPPHCGKPAGDLTYVPNDLSWYANIPVPTSYMCLGSKEDFFGGYDHFRRAGLVHVANHHISPGKKQWTWGNHEFGYAWDRNLTDEDGPYIELMAGVYTDNQPDFAFLQPGETKTWSQFWFPIREIGPAQKASVDGAISLRAGDGVARIGVAVTRPRECRVRLTAGKRVLLDEQRTLAPDAPMVSEVRTQGVKTSDLRLVLLDDAARELLAYQAQSPVANEPAPATEPPLPADIETIEELYVTGLHLAQYRHPTRMSEPYFEEALRRDPSDARCNNHMGVLRMQNGEFEKAEAHFRAAIARLTRRNPNPYDGEAYYNLGLALRYRADAVAPVDPQRSLELLDHAYHALYKAIWNHAWQAAGYHAIAEIDCRREQWHTALEHLDAALRVNTDNLKARDLRAIVLRKLGREGEATQALRETLALDPLDWWARHLLGQPLDCDSQTRLDLAHDFARAGFRREAIEVLADVKSEPYAGTAPTLHYTAAWLYALEGDLKTAERHRKLAQQVDRAYCFPSRVEEIVILQWAIAQDARDARAAYYLGNLFYDRKRHRDAAMLWEKSARLEPDHATVWRNLGIAYYNHLGKPDRARRFYDKAIRLSPDDARLLFERDLLWKRLGVASDKRLAALSKRLALVRRRDDLSVEYCELLNQVGRHQEALDYLASRRFQPWEGGEGLARGQHVRAHVALGYRRLAEGVAEQALHHFEQALASPVNLGEAKHLLANQSHVLYALGLAQYAVGRKADARKSWTAAASFRGDFQERAVKTYSELTYFSALSLIKFFPAGRYRMLPREGARQHLHLSGLRDVVLRGEPGTELLAGGRTTILRAEDCTNVRFDRLAFDYDPPLFSQGVITEIAADRRALTWKHDEGYVSPTAPLFDGLETISAIALDASDRFMPKSHAGIGIGQWTEIAPGAWRLTLAQSAVLDDRVRPGLHLLLYRRYRWTQAVVFSACRWMDLHEVEIWGAPEFAMYMESCTGVCLRRCHVRVKPGSGRLGGLNADGIHARSCRFGPMLYQCSVMRVQDDCLNFQSRMASVDDVVDDCSLVLDVAWNAADRIGYWSPHRGDFAPGDMLAVIEPATADLTGYARVVSTRAHSWNGSVRTLVSLDRPIRNVISRQSLGKRAIVQSSSEFLPLQVPQPVEHFVINASTKSDGFVIRGCELGDNTVTAGKIKAGNGMILENRTFNHGWCVWSFATEFVWQEGYAARRILVENNHFDNWFGIFLGSYHLFGRAHQGTPLNYRIDIINNTFAGTRKRELALDINNVVGCVVRDNELVADRPIAVSPTARSIWLERNTGRDSGR